MYIYGRADPPLRRAQVEEVTELERRRAPGDWVLTVDGPTPALDRAARSQP